MISPMLLLPYPAALLLLITAVVIIANWSARRFREEHYLPHNNKRKKREDWLIKAASGIPSVVLFMLRKTNEGKLVWQDWPQLIIAPFLVMALFWLLFDSALGIFAGKGIFYQGSDWNGRAKTSKAPFAIKIIIIALLTTLYFLL